MLRIRTREDEFSVRAPPKNSPAMLSQPRPRRAAFIHVEVLTVVAIVGILFALLLPAEQSARKTAGRVSCGNNVRQFALGCL